MAGLNVLREWYPANDVKRLVEYISIYAEIEASIFNLNQQGFASRLEEIVSQITSYALAKAKEHCVDCLTVTIDNESIPECAKERNPLGALNIEPVRLKLAEWRKGISKGYEPYTKRFGGGVVAQIRAYPDRVELWVSTPGNNPTSPVKTIILNNEGRSFERTMAMNELADLCNLRYGV